MTAATPHTVVLDASALLAAVHGEPGGADVERLLEGAAISAVNWAEVLRRCVVRDIETGGLQADLEALGLSIPPFTAEQAETTARLWPQTRGLGLSLGDRACLALAIERRAPALTADRLWSRLDVGVAIRMIR